MKSYYDCLNELSSNELLKGLLSYGMFNHKLPPIFSSSTFYDYCIRSNPIFTIRDSDWIRYDNNRNNGLPRQIGIPNPFLYYNQCKVLENNWQYLLDYFKEKTEEQNYKVSRIHIRKLADTSKIFEMNYENFYTDGSKYPSGIITSKYVVSADISNCFDNIYTHSVEWAIIGKSASKRRQQSYAGEIDKATRKTTYGETHGILIGPVTSNIISEIILCDIDYKLFSKYRFTRHIDDYKCYVKSIEEGEKFLSELRKSLLAYDLSINEKKTKISSITDYNNDDLSLRIHQLDFLLNTSSEYDKIKYDQLQVYFDALDKLYNELGYNASVYMFAFKTLYEYSFSYNASIYMIEKAMKLSYNNPYLLFGIQHYIFDKHGVTIELPIFCKDIYLDGIKEMNYEKSIYALFFAITNNSFFSLENDDDFVKNANENDDCLLKLLSYLFCRKFFGTKYDGDYVKMAKKYNNRDLINRYWIFVYEVLSENELKDDWKLIKHEGISFLNVTL